MATLSYVGKTPDEDDDVTTRIAGEAVFNSGNSRGYVDDRAHTIAITTRGSKAQVDGWTNPTTGYAESSYPAAKDTERLVPNTQKGAAGGVATLVSGKIPSAQVPILGAGILKGPYGHTDGFTVSGVTTPQKIANVAVLALDVSILQPMVFMQVACQAANNGRPVVEVRYSTSGNTTYAGTTLCAQGYGRSFYNDSQTVVVLPATALTGEGQDGVVDTINAGTTLTVTAWLYEGSGLTTSPAPTVATQSGFIWSCAMYLPRSVL